MKISNATSKILNQLVEVIQQISTEQYSQPLAIYNGSTIGQHFRHIHDFYECLIAGSDEGIVDYCKRERIEELEINPLLIIQSFAKMRASIEILDESKEIELHGDFEVSDGHRPISKSSIGREMLYAYDHAVHHLAIIKLGIRAEFPTILIDDEIGVAASTLRHQMTHTT